MDAKSQTTFRSFITKLGTYVLKKIFMKISTSMSRQLQIDQAQHKIRTNKWDPTSQSLRDFTAAFSNLKSILANMPDKPSPSQYRRWWITLLPPHFKDVQYLLLMDDLPPHWRDIDEITDLAEAMQIEIDMRQLTFQKAKTLEKFKKPQLQPSGRQPTQPTTPAVPPRADDSRRNPMLLPYTTSKDFYYHIKDKARAGNAQNQLETKYSTLDSQGCWLCRFKTADTAFRKETDCNQLKHIFAYSLKTTVSSSVCPPNQQNIHTPINRKTQPCPTILPKNHVINMCYDTGTFPSTLCDQPSFFSSITLLDSPKFIALGDNKTLVPALGEETLDYIIDSKYGMQKTQSSRRVPQ